MKHKRRYQWIIIAAIVALIPILIYTIDIQKVEDFYASGTGSVDSGSRSASILIDCGVLLVNRDAVPKELKDSGFIPEDGVILEKTVYAIEEDESVFDLLLKATKQKRIQMEFSGNPDGGLSSVYIRSIRNIYEFSCGPLSGWMFKVNGEFSGDDSSSVVLADGDLVEWVFTCDMGRDVGNDIDEGGPD
ncbi:MAG: DUF4430 domain-containing protein [Saccharofermentanales bacterium]|jgi:hypothetical protein